MESGGPSVGKVEECDVESWHLQGYSPRLCRLRMEGLVPAIRYWTYRSHAGDMGPVSPVACCWQKLGLSLLPLWLRVREKLDGDPQIGQPACCGCSQEFHFLRSSGIRPNPSKYVLTAWDTYGLGPYLDWAWDAHGMLFGFPLHGLHRFESSRLSNMSNRLSYGCHQVVN
jgi:hypothetical protein